MARPKLSAVILLEISLRCAQAFHEHDGDAPTQALVAASGLSERTFFRYFPTKEESLGPLLDAGNHRFADALTARFDAGAPDLVDAVVDAFAETFAADDRPWGDHLLELVLGVPALRRVWLETNEALPQLVWPALARSLDLPADHDDVLMAGDEAVLLAVCAVRVMARDHLGPREAAERVAAAFRRDPLAQMVHPERGPARQT